MEVIGAAFCTEFRRASFWRGLTPPKTNPKRVFQESFDNILLSQADLGQKSRFWSRSGSPWLATG